jgi:Fe-S-cluster-containing dehydrogenase component
MGIIMAKKLLIDLEICRKCKDCKAQCSYFFHPFNKGVLQLRELGEFSATCRHCEESPCVVGCPTESLEKYENGVVKRYNLRCVACKTCCFACPFGTILPEVIPYAVSRCDYCLGRLADGEVPICIGGCEEGAIQYGEFEPDDKQHHFLVSDHLIVHTIPWKKEEYV